MHNPDLVGRGPLKRSKGAYRQPFEVENLNRKIRGEHVPVVTSYLIDNSYAAALPVDGRLKVVPERTAQLVVPFEMSEGKFSHEEQANPINQMGPLLLDNVPLVTSNDFESFYAAFLKRCNYKQHEKDDDIDDDIFEQMKMLILSIPDQDWPEYDEDETTVARWYQKMDTSKQLLMKRAEENIPFCSSSYLGTKDLSVKPEVLLKRNDPSWAPRVIYAGNAEFNRVTGPAMMVVMERLVELLEREQIGGCKILLAYKTNDVALCEFLDSPLDHPHVYEGDFSANDREQRSRVTDLFDLWLEKLRMPTWLRTLFVQMSKFKVRNKRFGMTGKIAYQLPTGTTATTPRNSVYNGTMAVTSVLRQISSTTGVPFAQLLAPQPIPRSKMTILGDDILMVNRLKMLVKTWCSDVGKCKMVLKGKTPKLNGEATLLSRRLIYMGNTPCAIPLIGKALARFNARALDNMACSAKAYVAGKALSYAFEFRHVPFCRDYFLKRFKMENVRSEEIALEDLTWFTKSSGFDNVSSLMAAIDNETVLVSDNVFAEWLMETYELGLCDLEELFEQVVLSSDAIFIEHPATDKLAIDW